MPAAVARMSSIVILQSFFFFSQSIAELMKSTGAKVLELESDSGNVVALLQNELRVRTAMVCDKPMSIWYTRLFLVCINGGLARRHAVVLKIEKPGAKGCLGGIASAGWLEDHQIQSFSREELFELCEKTLLFLKC